VTGGALGSWRETVRPPFADAGAGAGRVLFGFSGTVRRVVATPTDRPVSAGALVALGVESAAGFSAVTGASVSATGCAAAVAGAAAGAAGRFDAVTTSAVLCRVARYAPPAAAVTHPSASSPNASGLENITKLLTVP
jgi:hypothetical protein